MGHTSVRPQPHPVRPRTASCPQTGEVLKFKQVDNLTEQAGQWLQSCEAPPGEGHLEGSSFFKNKNQICSFGGEGLAPLRIRANSGPPPCPRHRELFFRGR